MVDDERGRAALDGVGSELVAVAGETTDAEEEIARADGAVVIGETRYVDGRGAWEQNVQIHRRQRVATG
jgi:hypothetical protein